MPRFEQDHERADNDRTDAPGIPGSLDPPALALSMVCPGRVAAGRDHQPGRVLRGLADLGRSPLPGGAALDRASHFLPDPSQPGAGARPAQTLSAGSAQEPGYALSRRPHGTASSSV